MNSLLSPYLQPLSYCPTKMNCVLQFFSLLCRWRLAAALGRRRSRPRTAADRKGPFLIFLKNPGEREGVFAGAKESRDHVQGIPTIHHGDFVEMPRLRGAHSGGHFVGYTDRRWKNGGSLGWLSPTRISNSRATLDFAQPASQPASLSFASPAHVIELEIRSGLSYDTMRELEAGSHANLPLALSPLDMSWRIAPQISRREH